MDDADEDRGKGRGGKVRQGEGNDRANVKVGGGGKIRGEVIVVVRREEGKKV